MNTNQVYAGVTDALVDRRVCEHMPPAISGSDKEPPVSTEWCSELLGGDLICFLQELERRFQGSLRDQAKSLRDRICLASIREKKS